MSNGLDHWLSIAIYALVYLLVVLVNLVPDKAKELEGHYIQRLRTIEYSRIGEGNPARLP